MVYNRIQVAFGALKRITGPAINYQYDVKQILVINGLDLPEYYVVDFCNEGDATVIPMTGTSDGVEIPDSLLQTGKPVKAYIVVSSGQGDIQTRYEVKLPVNTRPMRDDIHPTDPQQQQIDALVATLNDGVSRAETAATEAEASAGEASADADRAEAAATRAEEAVEDVSAYTARAELAAAHAESSARDAAGSVETAAEKADEAAGSATAADESATEASGYADAARHSASGAAVSAQAAGTSASASAESAGQAASSAQSASGSATQASGSAQAAANSASSASQSATNAANKAQEAASKATEAGNAKDAAVTAKNDAVTAKNAAETAQGKAEDAQEAAEAAQQAAEQAAQDVINKAPVIINTASGEIANFVDGADDMPIKKLVGTIVPVQDLHGYENPWPGGGSVNKLAPASADTKTDASVSFVSDGNGKYTIQGTATGASANIRFALTSQYTIQDGDYLHIMNSIGAGNSSIVIEKPDTTAISNWGMDPASKIVDLSSYAGETIGSIRFYVASGGAYNGTVQPMIVHSSSVTPWTPYANICPISGWTGANIYQAGLPKGYTYANYITVNNAINIQTDIDFNAQDIEVICVHQPVLYKQYGAIYSAAYKGEAYNTTRLILNTSIGTNLFNNATRANSPGNFIESESSFIKTVNRFGSIDVNNRTITGNTNVGSNTDVTTFVVGGANMSVRYKYIVVKKTDASGGQRLLVLVACRNADGIAGLYDLVNGVFWTTASSSNISATGDAPDDLSVLYNVTLPINWQTEAGTIYDGSVEVIGGALESTMGMVDLSTLTWTPSTSARVRWYTDFPLMATTNINTSKDIAEKYKLSNYSGYASTDGVFYKDSNGKLYVSDASGSPTGKLVFTLVTPEQYQLTGQELTTLYGTNNIWIDTGSITECDYPADTKLYIDNKIATAIANALNA